MYKKARIRLTISYILIVTFISIILSSFIYVSINQITLDSLKKEEKKIEKNLYKNNQTLSSTRLKFSDETINEIKSRNFSYLTLFNLSIICISGIVGYWYAGKTLEPIEESDRKQKEFISNAAHELKTPITSSITSLEVSLRDPNLNLKESKSVMQSTIQDLNMLNKLVITLLRFQRTQENIEIKEDINLDDLLDKVIISFKPIILEKKLIFNKKIEAKHIFVFPNLFKELLIVLIDNAIKYSTTYGEVNIISKIVDDKTEIEIQDHGVGIPVDKIAFIFERFYMVSSSRNKERETGFGLGLSIAKEIVEKHNGTIECRSEENTSTIFKIIIPNK